MWRKGDTRAVLPQCGFPHPQLRPTFQQPNILQKLALSRLLGHLNLEKPSVLQKPLRNPVLSCPRKTITYLSSDPQENEPLAHPCDKNFETPHLESRQKHDL